MRICHFINEFLWKTMIHTIFIPPEYIFRDRRSRSVWFFQHSHISNDSQTACLGGRRFIHISNHLMTVFYHHMTQDPYKSCDIYLMTLWSRKSPKWCVCKHCSSSGFSTPEELIRFSPTYLSDFTSSICPSYQHFHDEVSHELRSSVILSSWMVD